MDCAFCQIASGTFPSHDVFRNSRIVAFMDTAPLRPGHVRIIPLAHHVHFHDLPRATVSDIAHLGQEIALVQKALFQVARVGFFFPGSDVPHVHADVIPIPEQHDIATPLLVPSPGAAFPGRAGARPPDLERQASAIAAELGYA